MSLPDSDRVQRFVVENEAVRGQFARLGASWLALREHGDYPAPVRALLGEMATAAVLLASTLKFEGILTLQLQGSGAVRLLVAQCTHDFKIRGVARFDPARITESFQDLAGDGVITATIESERLASRYQGVVPIQGESLAVCLEHYFSSSEQLPTRVALAADESGATGLIVQRIAGEGGAGVDDARAARARFELAESTWRETESALAGLAPDELLLRPAAELIQRSLAGRDLRLFVPRPVRFECRCTLERVTGMLRSLGEAEIRDVLREQGAVTVTCEFCHRPYRFDTVDVEQMFVAASPVPGSDRIN